MIKKINPVRSKISKTSATLLVRTSNGVNKIRGLFLDLIFPPICLVCRKRLTQYKTERNFPEARLEERAGMVRVSEANERASDESQRANTLGERAVARGNSFPFLCCFCSQKIKINNAAFCPVCSRRLPENRKTCHRGSPFILAAAGFYGDEILDRLIALLKYQKIKQAAAPLGEILSQYLKNLIGNWELDIRNFIIVPVPLYWRKEKQRGFNQSNLIADCLSKNTGSPIARNILKRTKNTASQVELKDKEKREINVVGCFEVVKPELISGKNIILLDDVFTTGATMKEAAKEIKKSGARKIIGLVVAKT